MGHTYTSLTYHVIFSTKERRPLISADLASRLTEFVGGVVRQRDGKLLAMGGTDNHAHVLAVLSPTRAVSDQVRDIKALSSGWIRDLLPNLKLFGWQEGYGAFSVANRNIDAVAAYIAHQEAHHRQKSFEEEFIEMLNAAGVQYDARYVFD